jgi:hypothetical protein
MSLDSGLNQAEELFSIVASQHIYDSYPYPTLLSLLGAQ